MNSDPFLRVQLWDAIGRWARTLDPSEVDSTVSAMLDEARAEAWDRGFIARTGDTPRYAKSSEWGNPYRDRASADA